MFKYFYIFLFIYSNIIFPKAIFSINNNENSFTSSIAYLKHEKIYNQYLYNCNFSFVLKGKIEFNIGYEMNKETPLIQNNYRRNNEYFKYSAKYFIHKNNFSFATSVYFEKGLGKNVLDKIDYVSFLFSKEFIGNLKTGMNYYPYFEYLYPNTIRLNDTNHANNPRSLKHYNRYIKIGCVITLNDKLFSKKLFVEPILKYRFGSKEIYTGIKIGVWALMKNS